MALALPDGRWKKSFTRKLRAWFDAAKRDLPWRRSRNRIHRNTGAPITAVMIPIGSSAGAITTRATTSTTSINVAPSSAEAGSRKV